MILARAGELDLATFGQLDKPLDDVRVAVIPQHLGQDSIDVDRRLGGGVLEEDIQQRPI